MAYQYWPSGVAPYQAYTYITDRTTPLNHDSIMNGIARDIGWIQHNINTTHLFASGYANPILSGFFKNIDTNYLYVQNLQTRNLELHDIFKANISLIGITGSVMNTFDSAFRGNNIQVNHTFYSPWMSINSSGLIYNGTSISGGLYDFYLQAAGPSKLLEGKFGAVTVNSGNITLNSTHRVIIENLGLFAPSGSITESGVVWNSSAGHNHINNKINQANITDAAVQYNDDLTITTQEGSIYVASGVIDADTYNLETYYDPIEFYEVDFAASGRYVCDRPALSGYIKDLDIGNNILISFNDKVYATSNTLPSGSSNRTYPYIYSTEDFYTWSGVMVSGSYTPTVSGVGTVDAMAINYGTLWFSSNILTSSGNCCVIRNITNINTGTGVLWPISGFAHGSSRYCKGLASIENNLIAFGYEYPHLYSSGMPKWDRHGLGFNTQNTLNTTDTTGQDLSYSGVAYKYSYPFVQGYSISYYNMDSYWLDGSYFGEEPALSKSRNLDLYTSLLRPNDNFSGYFAGLFGNGFSEVTAMLSTDLSYHNGQRGQFTHRGGGDGMGPIYNYRQESEDLIENYSDSPVLFFGNSTIYQHTSNGSGIFGGCIPIVLDVDKRMFDNLGETTLLIKPYMADYAPLYMHGSRSLMDQTTIFRIPSYAYQVSPGGSVKGLCNSNLYATRPNMLTRLWTDMTDNVNQKTELINMVPWLPSYLVAPFGGSGEIYYKPDNITDPIKLTYTSMLTDPNGVLIPSGTFPDHRNYPTYFDRPQQDGFWTSKSFDWYYTKDRMGAVSIDLTSPGVFKTVTHIEGHTFDAFNIGSGTVINIDGANHVVAVYDSSTQLTLLDSAPAAVSYGKYRIVWNHVIASGLCDISEYDFMYNPGVFDRVDYVSGNNFISGVCAPGSKITIYGVEYTIGSYISSTALKLTSGPASGLLSVDFSYILPSSNFIYDPEPPTLQTKSYYYMKPKCPIQHNGIIYCIMEDYKGFVYIGPNGSEYVDDGVAYTDLIKYGNKIYGVGKIYTKESSRLVLTTIRRNASVPVNLPANLGGRSLTPKFLIHKGLLYVGIGFGRFLVKKPSHTDLCITTNL